MPQTRFVTRKALALGLRPIVAINKIDRADAEPLRVHDEVLGLFIDLEADPRAARRAVPLYLEPRRHRDRATWSEPGTDLTPLFETILDHVPAPHGRSPTGRSRCWSRRSTSRRFLGPHRHRAHRARPGAGRRPGGAAAAGRAGAGARGRGVEREPGHAGSTPSTGSSASRWTRRRPATSSRSPGFEGIEIGQTFTDAEHPERLAGIAVEEPTISVDFIVNNSPVRRAGREVRHQPPAARPAVPGARAERRAPGGGDRQPRHAAPCPAAASCTSPS